MSKFGAPTGQPVVQGTETTAATPYQPNERHYVHHSYIWLNTVRMLAIIVFAVLVSSASSIGSLLAELSDVLDDSDPTFIITIGGLICLAILVVAGAITFLCYWLSYKHLYYIITDDEFNLHKGILNKTRVHVPYNKIQSIDQKATLLQRIIGVRTIYIDTAGGSSNKAIVVPYLTKHDAEWLRNELFARKTAAMRGYEQGQYPHTQTSINENASQMQAPAEGSQYQFGQSREANILDMGQKVWDDIGGVFAGESFESMAPSYEFGLSNKELFFAGLSNRTSFLLILLGILVAISQFVGTFLDLFPDQEALLDSVVNDTGEMLIGLGVFTVGASLIGIFIVIWVIGIIGTCLSYGGFKALRRGNRIEVQYGLLQHTFQGVDIDRVQAVVVKQTFIRRLIGYCEISIAKVDAASEGDKSNQQNAGDGILVHPFVKLAKAQDIIAGLIPEFNDNPNTVNKVAPVALRRALIRKCIVQGPGFWIALLTLLTQICVSQYLVNLLVLEGEMPIDAISFIDAIWIFLYIIAALITLYNAIDAVLWARKSYFAYDARFFKISNAGFSIETSTIPRKKIQYGYTKTNPLQRLAHTATINARTAAGIGGTTVTFIDAKSSDASNWINWLEPHSISG